MDPITDKIQSFNYQALVTGGIRIAFMVGLAWLIMFALKKLLEKLRHHLINKGKEEGELPSESEKRVDTIIRLVRQGIFLAVCITFGMVILKEVGIDVAPLIASAGIVGLAVGFGAQNLRARGHFFHIRGIGQ